MFYLFKYFEMDINQVLKSESYGILRIKSYYLKKDKETCQNKEQYSIVLPN